MSRKVVFLDGPPGAGKSTVLGHLAAKYKFTVIQEPLVQWSFALTDLEALEASICSRKDAGEYLESAELFRDVMKYEFALTHFQTLVLSWYQQLADMLPRITFQKSHPPVIVVERSPMSALVFHQLAMLSDDRTMECAEQLRRIGTQLPSISSAHHFNLMLSPEEAVARLDQRRAPGDTRWSVESLQQYYTIFDDIMQSRDAEIINIDATQTPEQMAEAIHKQVGVKPPSRSRFDMFF